MDVTSWFAKSGTWYTPTSLIWNGGPKYWAEQEFSETSSENRDISFASDKEEYKNKAMEYLAYVNQQESKGIPPPPDLASDDLKEWQIYRIDVENTSALDRKRTRLNSSH